MIAAWRDEDRPGFQPFIAFLPISWGVAPGWHGSGPLALQTGPVGLAAARFHRGQEEIAERGHSLDALDLALEAAFSPGALQSLDAKKLALHRLNLLLEKLRVLWRLVHERKFISQQQLFFAVGKIDEIGRMTGGWIKSLDGRAAPRQ